MSNLAPQRRRRKPSPMASTRRRSTSTCTAWSSAAPVLPEPAAPSMFRVPGVAIEPCPVPPGSLSLVLANPFPRP